MIYPETSIWNELCDQATEPQGLSAELAKQGTGLVLGINVFYEMVKTFGMRGEEGSQRASQLFSYLKEWVHGEFPIVRQTPEILIDEAFHALGRTQPVKLFLDGLERHLLQEEIARLANGAFAPPRDQFIETRKATAKTARLDMRAHVEAAPALASKLRSVPRSSVSDWLRGEAKSERGVSLLAAHLAGLLPEERFPELGGIAEKLVASEHYRVANALVRNGLYLNWRLAHRRSLPTSSLEDAYHVVNASYCSTFVTTDRDQADQASQSLLGVRVRFYGGGNALESWLVERNC